METEVLECGCEKHLIGNRYIWVNCEEHEEGLLETKSSNKEFKIFFKKE